MSALVESLKENTTFDTFDLHSIFTRLNLSDAVQVVAERFSAPGNPNAPMPTLKSGSDEFTYAVLVTNGATHIDACKELDLNHRTVEKWRTKLRNQGCAYYGREVDYEFVARETIKRILNRVQNRPNKER